MKKNLLLQFSLLAFFLPQAQQKSANAIHFSFDAGGGFYRTFTAPKQGIDGKGSGGISYLFSASCFYKKNIFKARFLKHDEAILSALDFAGPYPDEMFVDAGLMYGKPLYENKKTKLNLLAGVGFLKGYIRGKFIPYQPPPRTTPVVGMNDWFGPLHFGDEYEIEKIHVLSFIQEVEFMHYPSKHFGIGVSLTGNINSRSSHIACFLKLCAGKYR